MTKKIKNYHFIGIGGSGMSSLSYLISSLGHTVSGSDRAFKQKGKLKIFQDLEKANIKIFPQDGSGISKKTDIIITSTAIEKDNPDIVQANKYKIPHLTRSQLLAEVFNNSVGIAIGGTNGKTTVSGLLTFALKKLHHDPSYILGGKINNFKNLNACANLGKAKTMVIEADESDGSIKNYRPHLGLINNISKDHKEISELIPLFNHFAQSCSDKVIINADCRISKKIKITKNKKISFSLKEKKADIHATHIKKYPFFSTFMVDNCRFTINLPGEHNIYNTLAVISILKLLNYSFPKIAAAIQQFKGMHRRMELIADIADIKIIDDFGHNPEKIKAALLTARKMGKRILAFFQPHGFAPTAFLKKEYIETFKNNLRNTDFIFIPEIYYAGGTVSVSISANDLITAIKQFRKNAFYLNNRDELLKKLPKIIKPGDVILLMGARDPSLVPFAKTVKKIVTKTII